MIQTSLLRCSALLALGLASPSWTQSLQVVDRVTPAPALQRNGFTSDGTQVLFTGGGFNPTTAPVLTLLGGKWTQTASLLEPIPYPGFADAVAIDGEWAAAATRNQFGFLGLDLYRRTGLTWGYFGGLTSSLENRGFAKELALSGTTLAAADPRSWFPELSAWRGSITLFEFDGTNWVEGEILMTPRNDSRFGTALDLDGDLLATVAPLEDSGYLYIYQRTGEGWRVDAKIPHTQYPLRDPYIDLQGQSLILGLEGDFNTSVPGDASIYERINGAWTLTASLSDPGQNPWGTFGEGVAIDGKRAAVLDRGWNNNQGRYYLYEKSPTGSWTLSQTLDGQGGGERLAPRLGLHESHLLSYVGFPIGPLIAMDIPATASSRNGSSVNRTCYSADVPILGTGWEAEVDVSGHPGANLTLIQGAVNPLPGSMTTYGELLIGGPKLFINYSIPISGTGTHLIPLPLDLSLSGRRAATQAVILGGQGGPELCNAVDLVLGF